MKNKLRLARHWWWLLVGVVSLVGVAGWLAQPVPVARGKAAPLPIVTALSPEDVLAQTLALADPRVQALTLGRRTEVFVIKQVTAGQFTAPASACATADCRQVEIFNFDASLTIAALVNVDTQEVLDVLQIQAKPGINARLIAKAINLIVHDPVVIETLGRQPQADEFVPMEASYQGTACGTTHPCVAGTFPLKDTILWAFVDLTEEKVVGYNWTNIPAGEVPETYMQRPMEAPADCTNAGVVNRDGWTMDYATTATDGFRVYNVRFNNTLVISNAKMAEWHADYGSSGYVDATGCSPSGGFPIYPFGDTLTNTLVYTPTGETVGFEVVRDFRMSNWGAGCNYRYEQRMQFFKDGRFRVLAVAYGKGCGTTPSLYRPLLRIDLAVNGDANDAWGNWMDSDPAWTRQMTETWWLQDKNTSPEGYKWSITDTVSNLGYYVAPGNGQFGYYGGDVPPVTATNAITDKAYLYLVQHKSNEGDTDMGAVGTCCLDDHQQGPHNYVNGENTSDTNLVIWYIPQMLTERAAAPYRCWTVTTSDYYPCFAGPMFIPMPPPATFAYAANPTSSPTYFSTTTPLLSPVNYTWEFGDGTTATGIFTPTGGAALTAQHTYYISDTFNVTLTLGNAAGTNTLAQSVVITSNNSAPLAQFTAPLTGTPGTNTVFTNTTPNYAVFTNTWNFGDGSQEFPSNAANVLHGYPAPGNYTVLLTVTNEFGSNTASHNVLIDYAAQAQLTAPTQGATGTALTFWNTSPHYAVLSNTWNFGDGTVQASNAASVTHTYAQPGHYTVLLTVTSQLDSATTAHQITIGVAPQAQFTAPMYATVGRSVTFTNTSTDATSYLWQFSDGVTSTLVSPVRTFGVTGPVTVTLTAFNNFGTTQTQHTLNAGLAPQAQLSAPATSPAGLPVQFLNQSLGTAPLDVLWDFGDGVTSTVSAPQHTYVAPGNYTVTLTVSSPYGTSQTTRTVQVAVWQKVFVPFVVK